MTNRGHCTVLFLTNSPICLRGSLPCSRKKTKWIWVATHRLFKSKKWIIFVESHWYFGVITGEAGIKNRLTHRTLEIGPNPEWSDAKPPMGHLAQNKCRRMLVWRRSRVRMEKIRWLLGVSQQKKLDDLLTSLNVPERRGRFCHELTVMLLKQSKLKTKTKLQ